MQIVRFSILVAVAAAGCDRDRSPASQPAPAPAVATAPAPTAPAPGLAPGPTAPADGVSGMVVETMDAAGYTYAKLDQAGKQVWVAGPQTKLKVGDKIGTVSGNLMTGFRSNTLNRTFDEIYFIGSFPLEGTAAIPPNPHGGAAPAIAPPTEKVAPAAGGQTVAQVFANKAALSGKPVVVRGKVMKVNTGILDRNWIHLQDGTGAAGSNDLMVTTSATAAVGDIVVVRGTLATDKDFGAGYTYAVIVENAVLAAK